MNTFVYSLVIGSVVGIGGTGLGGVIALFLKRPTARTVSVLMALAGGIMLSVVIIDMLPHALIYTDITQVIISVLAGVLVMLLCERVLGALKLKNPLSYTGAIIGAGIALHNLPEGLAIGTGLSARDPYTLSIIIIMMLHDIPEGMAMGVPLRAGNESRLKTLGAVLLSGVPTGIGAIVGYKLGEVSPLFIGASLGFAGGAMLCVTLRELLPQARSMYSGKLFFAALFAGAMIGAMIVFMFE